MSAHKVYPFMSFHAFAKLRLNLHATFGDVHSVVCHAPSGTINAIVMVSKTTEVIEGEILRGAKLHLWMEN